MKLRDAVVLVTGASGDIGAGCAAALSSKGARVIVTGRDTDRLNALAADLGAKALVADLLRPDAVDSLVSTATEIYGQVDGVVHSAGVGWRGATSAMSAAQLDDLVDLNVRVPLLLSGALLPGMLARGAGHVSFLGSIAGWTGVRHEAVYAATKSAVITYAESLRAELIGTGVGVSVVSPGAVRTAFFANRGVAYDRRFPRPIGAERVAHAVVAGIEHDRAHQMIPRWLAAAPAVRTSAPGLFRALNRRLG
jgi:short-subunit dehydrogenase